LFSTAAGLSTLLNEAEDSGVEQFKDVPEDEDKGSAPVPDVADVKPAGEYDGRKRDPLFANAKASCLWELVCLAAKSCERPRLSSLLCSSYRLLDTSTHQSRSKPISCWIFVFPCQVQQISSRIPLWLSSIDSPTEIQRRP